MTKSKQEWDKQITEIIMEPITPSNALSFSDRNKKVLEIVDVLLKAERQRVVEMIEGMKWDSREEITEWLLGKEDTAKRNMLIDEIIKNISDLQSKLGGTK